ncbi:hypothetical protein K1719_014544 [Acacia pycnantha]|nr:hypothetical protein K1719_014544 [Acacia pycnantha]
MVGLSLSLPLCLAIEKCRSMRAIGCDFEPPSDPHFLLLISSPSFFSKSTSLFSLPPSIPNSQSRRKCRESARGINDFDLEIGVFLWAEKNPKCGDMTTGRSNKSKTNYSFNCRLRV